MTTPEERPVMMTAAQAAELYKACEVKQRLIEQIEGTSDNPPDKWIRLEDLKDTLLKVWSGKEMSEATRL